MILSLPKEYNIEGDMNSTIRKLLSAPHNSKVDWLYAIIFLKLGNITFLHMFCDDMLLHIPETIELHST